MENSLWSEKGKCNNLLHVFQNMITIVTKGDGDEEPGMLTIPVSTSIPVTGEGDIVIEQSKLQ